MNKYKIKAFLSIPLLSLLFVTCEQEPIFTEMSTNKLKIVIKGTLESDATCQLVTFDHSVVADDSVDDEPVQGEDVAPTEFMFDIAGVKLDGKAIGNYRQVFNMQLDNTDPFFNGTGVVLKNDDPGDGSYGSVQLYIRKMIFDKAMIYQNNGSSFVYEEPAEVVFNEQDVNGFNFNSLQVNSYWDSLRDNSEDIIRIFPLEIPITGGMTYDRDNDETVLEIRIVIKNFIKMYEYDYYDEGIYKVCHFWGLSDWLRDVRKDEHDMGRNIHAVARAYVPGKTGTITGTGPAANSYVMLIPSGEQVVDYSRTASGVSLRNNVSNCDFPVAPVYSSAHIESVLDYYCNYEAYKVSWNTKLSTCPDFTTYSAAWEGYEASVEEFKIAPYVTIANGSGYTFNSVAPGTYTIWSNTAPSTNSLFESSWTSVGTVTVTEGNTSTP